MSEQALNEFKEAFHNLQKKRCKLALKYFRKNKKIEVFPNVEDYLNYRSHLYLREGKVIRETKENNSNKACRVEVVGFRELKRIFKYGEILLKNY